MSHSQLDGMAMENDLLDIYIYIDCNVNDSIVTVHDTLTAYSSSSLLPTDG